LTELYLTFQGFHPFSRDTVSHTCCTRIINFCWLINCIGFWRSGTGRAPRHLRAQNGLLSGSHGGFFPAELHLIVWVCWQ